jgi:alpha-beta hydrolase superfamily lysophospholipase
VIDARQTRASATKLGRHVTMVALQDALHDVTLSAAPVRAKVYEEITHWLAAYGPRD